MTNILYIIDHIWNSNGGTEGQLLMLLNNLDPAQYRVHMFYLKETPWSRTARPSFPSAVLHIHRLLTPRILEKLAFVRRYCRENKIDIIQTYFDDALIFGVIAGRFSGVKCIIACRRNLGPGFWGRKALLRTFRLLRPLISRYMTNSLATRESIVKYEGIDPNRVEVIYNGLDLSRFCGINENLRLETRARLGLKAGEILIGMVAHLRKGKNFPLLLSAAAAITKKYPHVWFIIMGEGGEKGNIERKIDEMGLHDSVIMAGTIADVVPYLAAMDIACLTSDGESFSNSIIEYQAAGLPVVATAVGGNIEALQANGFLFPPGDLDAFVAQLCRLIDEPDLRRRTGQAARGEAFEKYSVDKMVSAHEAMYRNCLGCPEPED